MLGSKYHSAKTGKYQILFIIKYCKHYLSLHARSKGAGLSFAQLQQVQFSQNIPFLLLCFKLQAWRVLRFIIFVKKEATAPQFFLISESGTISSTSI